MKGQLANSKRFCKNLSFKDSKAQICYLHSKRVMLNQNFRSFNVHRILWFWEFFSLKITYCFVLIPTTLDNSSLSFKEWWSTKYSVDIQCEEPSLPTYLPTCAAHPPINTRGTGWKKIDPVWRNTPHPSCFCYGWFTSTIVHLMWTNDEIQTNKQSTYSDDYG